MSCCLKVEHACFGLPPEGLRGQSSGVISFGFLKERDDNPPTNAPLIVRKKNVCQLEGWVLLGLVGPGAFSPITGPGRVSSSKGSLRSRSPNRRSCFSRLLHSTLGVAGKVLYAVPADLFVAYFIVADAMPMPNTGRRWSLHQVLLPNERTEIPLPESVSQSV